MGGEGRDWTGLDRNGREDSKRWMRHERAKRREEKRRIEKRRGKKMG